MGFTVSVKLAAAVAGLWFLSGCASTSSTLYDWGNYEDNLFNYYHKPVLQEAILADHLALLATLDAKDQRPAPGLLAEAGTLLLLKGDTDGAIQYYQLEHDAWPESRPMMQSLITNLKKEQQ